MINNLDPIPDPDPYADPTLPGPYQYEQQFPGVVPPESTTTATPPPTTSPLDGFFGPDGAFNGDYQGYFNAIFPGGTLTPAELKAKEAELRRAGITLHSSTSGDNIFVPGIGLVDVIHDANGLNGKVWQPGGGAGGAGAPIGVDPTYLQPFLGQFGGPQRPEGATAADWASWYPEFKMPTAQDMYGDPGYQFRMDQGRGAIENSAAARGVLNTGGTLGDIMKFGQEFGSQEFGNVFNRNLAAYGANRQNAVGNYNDAYNRAWQQFGDQKDTWYKNQSNPWDKLYQASSLGYTAAAS